MIQLADPTLLKTRCFIGGRWYPGPEAPPLRVSDPASGETLALVPACGAAETREAIAAAAAAFPGWRSHTAAERGRVLRRWHELMLEHREDLALLMTREQGKPLAESRGEIAYAAAFLEWFAEEGKRTYGELIPSPYPDKRLLVTKGPIGVAAAITPWNFPSAMLARKAGAALAAGCTLVAKPAEQTPLSALAMAGLAERAGLPPGVLNLVCGDPLVIGPELTASPMVRKLSFTGSTEVGRLLMAQCAPTLKRVSLELGGNAPFIVLDDADLEAAVAGAIASKYRNSGQTCVCANRFLVQAGIYEPFAQALAQAVGRLKVGSGLDPEVAQGPLIDESAVLKVESLVADALGQGARVLGGGHRHRLGGTFFEPTVLTELAPSMRIAREEVFGPVAPLFRFVEDTQAIALANDTEYGLAAYLYGRDLSRVWRLAEALEYGMVGINTGMVSTEVAPFGGVKGSGFGREGSRRGIDEYLELKYLCLGGI
jgi:succinate-semialdehyde dehydrogenase/glutarate-semialdehyde dehydrogenase